MDASSGYRTLTFLALLLLLSAFFSAAETALTSINKIRLKHMVDEKHKNAEKVDKLITNQVKLLSTILIGNNIVNVAASSLATYFAISIFGDNSLYIGIVTFLLTFTILIFCEITPKTIAGQNAERVSFLIVHIMSFFVRILTPLVTIVNIFTGAILKLFRHPENNKPVITESELKAYVNVSHTEGVLEVDEKEMIHNVFKFGDTNAYDVCTPRTDIVGVSKDSTYVEVFNAFKENGFSRIPVYQENYDNIIGIIHIKDFFFEVPETDFDIQKILRPAFFTYESKPTLELFNEMRLNRTQMAIVLDEHGGTAGLLTMGDFIEEIVGDLSDDYHDIDDDITLVKENEVLVDASTRIEDVNKMLDVNMSSGYYESVGGVVIEHLGRVPDLSQEIFMEFEGKRIKFIVEELDKNRIEKLRITVIEEV